MATQITIDPVTRIEGHAKITIQLDDQGEVQDAAFHITQFRGFEKFTEGRLFTEMPAIMARICGICPISHLVASAKACDAIMAVRIPAAAERLRRVVNLAQLIQSHALSFFYLSSPDFLLGMDGDPADRNLFGVARLDPELARDGIRLRQLGQQMIEWLAGRRIHPSWVVPGGVASPLDPAVRERILAALPEGIAIAERRLAWFTGLTARFAEEIAAFASFPSLFAGLVGPDGAAEYYDGTLRFIGPDGAVLADLDRPSVYLDLIHETVEPWTYLKFPYFAPLGYPDGSYRVGPLARLNIAARLGTPRADARLRRFRERWPGTVHGSFHYHEARLIEILHAFEAIEALLMHPESTEPHVRAEAGVNRLEGIGIAEAPRGTLIHHYRVDEGGRVTWANLIIATGQNNRAMNQGVVQAARRYLHGPELSEGMLNRVEAVIRTFDPCLSCSTHALGRMPLHIQLRGPGGALLDEVKRG